MHLRKILAAALVVLTIGAFTAQACHIKGQVICPNGIPAEGVVINVLDPNSLWTGSTTTDPTGAYYLSVPASGATYGVCVDVATLPVGASIVGPSCMDVFVAAETAEGVGNFILSGWFCGDVCWFTGGGAIIDPLLGIPVATLERRSGGRTPEVAFGGNVYPGCSPTAGGGGSWNHVDRISKLHFHGTDIEVVMCGNVPGIPDGSTSPVTPYNFIEYQGVGWLKGIKGNKVDLAVLFYARCEDRNEPGSKGARDGALIDRYYLRVYTLDEQGVATNHLLVTGDSANPENVVPIPITDGNFQLHISSCDNPPQ